MNEKLISIGIPCYNAEKTIAKTIESIINQTYTDWELIIINDGSRDNSLIEIEKFCDNRIIVINRENKGLPASLNEIASLAKGKYLARMDSDDIMLPNRIEKQVEYLENNSDVNLLGGGIICIDDKENDIGERFAPKIIKTAYQIFKGEIIFHPTIIGKTEWFKKNPYDENLIRSEDFELWCRTADSAIIHNLQEPLIYYREYAENTTLSKYLLQSKISRKIIFKYGIKKIGLIKTFHLISRRFIKDFIYIIFATIGLWKFIISRRNV